MPSVATKANTSYNKTKNQTQTLVGNWYEERCLKDDTGVNRYQTWVRVDDQDGLYATRQNAAEFRLPTQPRVMEHTEQLRSEDWISHKEEAFQAKGNSAAQYVDVPNVGPRERLDLQQLQLIASKQDPLPRVEHLLETTSRADYIPHNLEGVEVGARVMKDPDGRAVQRDPVFLAEAKIMEKSSADRLIGLKSQQSPTAAATARLANPDIAVTLYSEAAAKGTYTGSIYGTRTIGQVTPFGKSTNFTKHMSDFTKVVEDE